MSLPNLFMFQIYSLKDGDTVLASQIFQKGGI